MKPALTLVALLLALPLAAVPAPAGPPVPAGGAAAAPTTPDPGIPATTPDSGAAVERGEPTAGAAVEAGEQLWGGLFWGGDRAYNGDPDATEPPAAALAALRANPHTRCEHYALIGHDAATLPAVWFTWIRFSEEFFLRVERGGANDRGELLIDVQLWQQDQLLVSTAVILTGNRPLVIRGPAWRDGYLFATLLLEEG